MTTQYRLFASFLLASFCLYGAAATAQPAGHGGFLSMPYLPCARRTMRGGKFLRRSYRPDKCGPGRDEWLCLCRGRAILSDRLQADLSQRLRAESFNVGRGEHRVLRTLNLHGPQNTLFDGPLNVCLGHQRPTGDRRNCVWPRSDSIGVSIEIQADEPTDLLPLGIGELSF